MGIKSLLGFGQARDKPVRNYSNGEYSFNFGRSTSEKSVNEMTAMLICPYCGKTLRRRQVYKKKIQWLCSTYIEKGVKVCKGIRIDDAELQELNIAEQTVVEKTRVLKS